MPCRCVDGRLGAQLAHWLLRGLSWGWGRLGGSEEGRPRTVPVRMPDAEPARTACINVTVPAGR